MCGSSRERDARRCGKPRGADVCGACGAKAPWEKGPTRSNAYLVVRFVCFVACSLCSGYRIQGPSQLLVTDQKTPLVTGVLTIDLHRVFSDRFRLDRLDQAGALDGLHGREGALQRNSVGATTNVYLRIVSRNIVRRTNVALPSSSSLVINEALHFHISVPRKYRHPFNIVLIEVMGFHGAEQASDISLHVVLASTSLHLHDIIRARRFDGTMDLYDGLIPTGELDVSIDFHYGLYGFGYSPLLNNGILAEEALGRSLYPRITDIPRERLLRDHCIVAPKAMHHPSFIPFRERALIGYGRSERVLEHLEATEGELLELPLLALRMQKLQDTLEGCKEGKSRFEKLRLLRQFVLSGTERSECYESSTRKRSGTRSFAAACVRFVRPANQVGVYQSDYSEFDADLVTNGSVSYAQKSPPTPSPIPSKLPLPSVVRPHPWGVAQPIPEDTFDGGGDTTDTELLDTEREGAHGESAAASQRSALEEAEGLSDGFLSERPDEEPIVGMERAEGTPFSMTRRGSEILGKRRRLSRIPKQFGLTGMDTEGEETDGDLQGDIAAFEETGDVDSLGPSVEFALASLIGKAYDKGAPSQPVYATPSARGALLGGDTAVGGTVPMRPRRGMPGTSAASSARGLGTARGLGAAHGLGTGRGVGTARGLAAGGAARGAAPDPGLEFGDIPPPAVGAPVGMTSVDSSRRVDGGFSALNWARGGAAGVLSSARGGGNTGVFGLSRAPSEQRGNGRHSVRGAGAVVDDANVGGVPAFVPPVRGAPSGMSHVGSVVTGVQRTISKVVNPGAGVGTLPGPSNVPGSSFASVAAAASANAPASSRGSHLVRGAVAKWMSSMQADADGAPAGAGADGGGDVMSARSHVPGASGAFVGGMSASARGGGAGGQR